MLKRIPSTIWLSLLLCLLTLGCTDNREQKMLDEGNAVYYWRTDLRLDSEERAFLATYNINKVYCRYFDVVMNENGEPMPNATITFSDTLPAGVEMVPTVYITIDCLQKPHKGLAAKLVKRIRQMNETNGISGVKEIQIDHDYTARNMKVYYDFLREVLGVWRDECDGGTLSTTIRLHQLAMEAPPADYGVLMIYNTGDPQKFMERNPILDIRDVAPYTNRLDGYPLPLAAAYPVYQWVRNIHGVRIEHTVEAEEILRVKKTAEKSRPDLSRAIITYHLDKENINRYKPETYEEIYHH
ncbi:MAG: hypothetical protein IJV25_05290 [Prevotella sp.]|nr:hypothetical protein [Prevotella sp.]